MGAPVVSLRGVGVRFGARPALSDVELSVDPGERVALVGPSGAGKTTLLSVLNGTVAPTSGQAEVLGVDLASASAPARRAAQARVGTVHQQHDLVGPMRVVHNVNAGRLGRWSLARAARSLAFPHDVPTVVAALDKVGVGDKLYERADRLSGGERQRVALARMLVQEPDLILADEPIASLDRARAAEVMDLLRSLAEERGRTLVVSLHAFDYALSHCGRVVGLRGGRVMFDASPGDVSPAMAEDLYRLSADGVAP